MMLALNKLTDKQLSDHFGVVVSIRDTIAKVCGLNSVTSGELVSDLKGNVGLVLNLELDLTGIVMFSEDNTVAGDTIVRLFSVLNTKIDIFVLGGVFDPLGSRSSFNPFLNNSISADNITNDLGILSRTVELKAPGIITRQPVYEPLFTGFIGIDGLLPLGQGQRELIIGDRQTGKTAIAVDIILNQASVDMLVKEYSVY